MEKLVLYSFTVLALTAAHPKAQTAQDIQVGTETILSFAEQLCGELDSTGSVSKVEMDGQADAGIALLSKRLLDLGISGAAKLEEGEYSNVLREQLADDLQDNRGCRRSVFDKMFSVVFGAIPEVALTESQRATLGGRVRPHTFDVVPLNTRFLMKFGEKLSLGKEDLILSLKKHGSGVQVGWVDLSTDERGGSTSGLAEGRSIDLPECKLTLYHIDQENEAASFSTAC